MDKTFHMVGGEEEASYKKKSSRQRLVLNEVKPLLMKCIEELQGDMEHLPNCIGVADLGCSSGPNLFLTAKNIIESMSKVFQSLPNQDPSSIIQIQYVLNDLVSNDFNLVFKGLPELCKKLEKESDTTKFRSTCHIASMSGSFYGKLFPDRSLHFLHSSYCLHWLSQVPNELANQPNSRSNRGSIYCGKTSPPEVHQACLDQFSRDFTQFLRFRSQEMVQNGQLFITFLCKHEEDLEVDGYIFLFLLGVALTEMVTEIMSYFHVVSMDNLFGRYANKLVNALQLGKAIVNNLVISLRKE